jgi:hypothetical protein
MSDSAMRKAIRSASGGQSRGPSVWHRKRGR